MLRPQDAYKLKTGLIRDIRTRHDFAEAASHYLGDGPEWMREESALLSQATTFFVASQMNTLLEMGLRDLNDEMQLERYHLPAQHGFCVFEEPLAVGGRILDGENQPLRAFSWQTWGTERGDNEGITTTYYMDSIDEAKSIGPLTPMGKSGFFTEDRLGNLRSFLTKHWQDIADERGEEDKDIDRVVEEYAVTVKVCWTVWFMMHQQVTEVVNQSALPPGKLPPLVKKGKRRIRLQPPEVRVINLRRRNIIHGQPVTVAEDQAHQAREWQHQWVVKGHWRMQPYGPQRSLRRPVYIHPHIKGPEDKPLLSDSKKVYRLAP